jgi:hypothetical protein
MQTFHKSGVARRLGVGIDPGNKRAKRTKSMVLPGFIEKERHVEGMCTKFFIKRDNPEEIF